nr:hypothetical protein KitaXyl93_63870 [Kitasatospora sp. Xyl93]
MPVVHRRVRQGRQVAPEGCRRGGGPELVRIDGRVHGDSLPVAVPAWRSRAFPSTIAPHPSVRTPRAVHPPGGTGGAPRRGRGRAEPAGVTWITVLGKTAAPGTA